ncbi:MAG: haloacid dehalogenase-like hydrolase [Candidatus Limivicinus sp.]|jgi:phosphatidylglycerophosphatase C
MNTYDFDETIYIRDSSVAFYFDCLRKYPAAVVRTFPGTLWAAFRHAFGCIDTRTLKEQLFSFLRFIENIDAVVADFWSRKFCLVGEWYLKQRKDDDVIISASPEFLLKPAAEKLNVRLIATDMDKKTGHIQGKNCHDSEKVRRFYERFPEGHTEEFYSDSLSDSPMAGIADRAYIVKKGSLSPWPEK